MNIKFFIIVGLLILLIIGKQLPNKSSIANIIGKPGNASFSLQKIRDIPLTGESKSFGYQSIDVNTGRLYISHVGSNMVHVFDTKTQKIIANIPVTTQPNGIVAIPSLSEVFVTAEGSNQVGVIDENTLRISKYIPAGNTPDGIAFYPVNGELYVSNDENNGTISVINTKTKKYLTNIQVGKEVGDTHNYDRQERIYTADVGGNKFVEIDPATNKVVKKYALPGCSRPHGFLIDPQTHYAFIACDGNNVMLVFDLDSKKIIASNTVGKNPDVLAYDEGLHYLYIAAQSGIMTVFTVQKGQVKKIYVSSIAPRAHTVAVNQITHDVYLPLVNIGGKSVLRIYKPML
jgi:YVTN family beta-propeller protein